MGVMSVEDGDSEVMEAYTVEEKGVASEEDGDLEVWVEQMVEEKGYIQQSKLMDFI